VSVRRRVGLVVTVAVVGGLLAVSGGFVGVAVATETAPECSTVNYTQNGSGWYEVENVSQLQCIGANGLSEDYVLIGDIDASGTNQWNGGAGFEPIANESAFNGSFDGAGNTIANLTIDRPSSSNPVGLFSELAQAASVDNVMIDGANITGDSPVGGLVGVNKGQLTNVTVTGPVSGTGRVGGLIGLNENRMTDATAMGPVTGSNEVGGLIGNNEATVINASSAGKVTVSGDFVGGLIGISGGRVTNVSAAGDVILSDDAEPADFVGGLIGISTDQVISASATGDVTASGDYVGGLIGRSRVGPVTQSYATGSVSGDAHVGGLIGEVYGDLNTSYATGTVNATEKAGGAVGTADGASVVEVYATGSINTENDSTVGGLIGRSVNSPTVSNSYWNVKTTNQSSSDGGTALTTAQMTDDRQRRARFG